MLYEKPATRTSTLATLDDAVTLPLKVSPGLTVLELIENARIWGGASGARYGIAVGVDVAAGSAVFCTFGTCGAAVTAAAGASGSLEGCGDGVGPPGTAALAGCVGSGDGTACAATSVLPGAAEAEPAAGEALDETLAALVDVACDGVQAPKTMAEMHPRTSADFMARQRSF